MGDGIEKTLRGEEVGAFMVREVFGEEAKRLIEYQHETKLIWSHQLEEIEFGIYILRSLSRGCGLIARIHRAHKMATGYARLGKLEEALFHLRHLKRFDKSEYESTKAFLQTIHGRAEEVWESLSQTDKSRLESHEINPFLPSNQTATKVALIVGGKLVELKPADKPFEPLDPLSMQIYKTYCSYKQAPETFIKEMHQKDELEAKLKNVIANSCLHAYGKSLDLKFDHNHYHMCHEVPGAQPLIPERSHERVKRAINSLSYCSTVYIDVDPIAFKNDQLLTTYSRLDERVAPLVINVKSWAWNKDIILSRGSTLSDYALTLLVIHYLQCGCTPSVLPNLFEMAPTLCDSNPRVGKLYYEQDLPEFTSRNNQSLGELFIGFFRFYSQEFDFHKYSINMREARQESRYLHQIECILGTSSEYILIKDFFNGKNVAQNVCRPEAYLKIKKAFQSSYWTLVRSRDLNSLGYQW